MLTVNHDAAAVELNLSRGQLSCPGCAGRLGPWGWARPRSVRDVMGDVGHVVRHHPRRARCVGCKLTHVLLPVSLAARRADTAAVIASAIEAKTVEGLGHRVIAAKLGRPASTVRGWLRAFASCSGLITDAFAQLMVWAASDAARIWPAPAVGSAGALSALLAYAEAVKQRFGVVVTVAWVEAGIAACNGSLFCGPWWVGRPNTNAPLPGWGLERHAGRCVCPGLVAGVFTAI